MPVEPTTQLALFDTQGQQAQDGQLYLTPQLRAPGITHPQNHLVQTPFSSVYLQDGSRVGRTTRPGGPLHLNHWTRKGPDGDLLPDLMTFNEFLRQWHPPGPDSPHLGHYVAERRVPPSPRYSKPAPSRPPPEYCQDVEQAVAKLKCMDDWVNPLPYIPFLPSHLMGASHGDGSHYLAQWTHAGTPQAEPPEAMQAEVGDATRDPAAPLGVAPGTRSLSPPPSPTPTALPGPQCVGGSRDTLRAPCDWQRAEEDLRSAAAPARPPPALPSFPPPPAPADGRTDLQRGTEEREL